MSAVERGDGPAGDDAPIGARELSRLRWRCRRGMLENDLLVERFFATHGDAITVAQARGLQALMDLADNDLLDLLLARKQPSPGLSSPEVDAVLRLMRPRGASAIHDTSAPTPAIDSADQGSEEPR